MHGVVIFRSTWQIDQKDNRYLLRILESPVSFRFTVLGEAFEFAENDQRNNEGRFQVFLACDGLDR